MDRNEQLLKTVRQLARDWKEPGGSELAHMQRIGCAAMLDSALQNYDAAPPPPAEQGSGELSHAVDLMRDVYMSKAQREAYERILAAALNLEPTP